MAGSEPTPEPGARIEREGARVLLLDDDGRLLMLQGHDPHQTDRSWWFTPGGGREPGENLRETAVRELAEETGYVLEPHELIGPVWRRVAVFDFKSRPYVQSEVFYVGRLADAERRERSAGAWTADEEETIDEVVWLAEADLRDATIEVFPAQLREAWDVFHHWDGTTVDLGKADE